MQQEIEVQGLRLSPHQKRLWLWQQRGHRGQARAVVQLEGAFDEEAVHRALRRVIARHDSLRTSFYREPGMKVPFQVINEEADLFWQVVDLRHLPDERTREQAAGDAVRRIVDPDWETRPLIRGTFCRLTDVSGRLILEMPGLCADHWSLANVAAELSLLLDLGNDGTVDEAPVQYGQFSEWHHELLEGEEAEQGRAWWAGRKLTSNQVVLLPFERTDRLDGLDAASQAV